MSSEISKEIYTRMYYDENKYMKNTSLMFLVPGLYGLYNNEKFCSSLMIAGSLISLNYWKDPKPGFRRNLDLYFVRSCVGVFGYKILTSIDNWYKIGLITSLYSLGKIYFFKASTEYYKNNRFWYIYHISFHSLCFLGHSATTYFLIH